MTDKSKPRDEPLTCEPNQGFRFSTNRGAGKHKVRYVESGGGDADQNCRVCQPVVKPRSE